MVYCEDLRSPFNVGSIFRTAEAFGFSQVGLSLACPQPNESLRLRRSAMGSNQNIAWKQQEILTFIANCPSNLPIFGLELGGTPIDQFNFPTTGIVVLGSEELGIHPSTLALCRQSFGIATIPLWGSKVSLNVGVSFGILAQAWCQSLLTKTN
jgi:TrmH family RNA methyltransferase